MLGTATHFDASPTEQLAMPWLPAGFTPVAAVVCARAPQQRAGGGEDLVLLEKRATSVARLTETLRLDDQPPTNDPCTADLVGVVWFAMLDAGGRWVRPGVATDVCGKPRIEVRDALDQLDTTTVATTVLAEIESAEAAKAGCSQGWGEIVGVSAAEQRSEKGAFDPPTAGMRLCIYTVPASEQGSGKPAGSFERGGVLTAQAWTDLRRRMLDAGPIVPCTAHAGRFAVFRPTGGGGDVYLELDGCRRLMFDGPAGSVFRQADAALTDRVSAAV
ncbi:hypothetical protein GCM10010532_107830 [Dactylosporangium siamense]|uniref:Uncharacterized protein n=1 Tax=Dactylosporangium siamense TaxID=685454 RepID=A0A919PZJ5_9ACTN|nr:hypothetical protein Dsi01nite_105730 [Dactylosporangium siamense]